MAMVNCKECKAEISSKAEACPKCGAKVKHSSRGCGPFVAVIGLFFVVIMVAGIIRGPSDTSAAAPEKPAESQSNEKGTRAQTLMYVVKKSLRNPDSMKVESVIVTEALAVCATYRAQNGFGGMNVEQAVMSADQTQAMMTGQPGFATLWSRECAGKPGLETKYLFPR